ncbi:MAG TPA: alpha/beta fold hydrolase [Candidatus Polarisedimenticolaceae bacterium]|nr:alpha/beta fold hydrolase [Candidatus Polarisedimenticolaceae bacterium]
MRKSIIFGALTVVSAVFAAPAAELVDVGGYRLDTLRAGAGAPAIVLVGGLGNELETWSQITPAAAELSTVVAYSRAGIGRSEPGPHDFTLHAAVAELHALLARLQVKPPYVLVGASFGGLIVRLYTSEYPAEVAGLVLIDATHEQQVQRWGKLDGTYPAAFRSFFEEKLKTLKGAEAAETRETMRIQAAGAVEGMKPLPDIPIAVLTSMKVDPNPQTVNQTAAGHEAWRAMHDEWFRQSRNGEHIETTRSGHHIQDDEPQLVLGAIRFVVDRVRTQ